MTRTVMFLLALGVAAAGVCRADEDEPTLLDVKLSDWIKMLDEGKTAKERRKATIAVEQIGHARSRRVVPALVKALREDKEEVVRVAAARAIGRAVAKANDQAREDRKDELPKFETAREALTTALRFDKVDPVREAAALALGDIGADARQAAGSLGGALTDKHAPVVRAAATALRRMGREARDAQPALAALLANKAADSDARVEAAVALGLLREEAAAMLPTFKDIVADAKAAPRLRQACAEALGKFGKDGADAATVLGVVLLSKDSPSELRLAAVTALDLFGPDGKAAASALVKAALDEDRSVRCLAMQAIGKLNAQLADHRKDAIANLLKGLDDGNTEVIVTALDTLGAMASEGFGADADAVLKRIDVVIVREGRKVIQEAARAAREKIRPSKK